MLLGQALDFPCHYHSANAPYSSSSACCSYQKNKRAKRGDLLKTNVLKSRSAWKKAKPTSLLQYLTVYGIALKLRIDF